jgi:hypothetical protein
VTGKRPHRFPSCDEGPFQRQAPMDNSNIYTAAPAGGASLQMGLVAPTSGPALMQFVQSGGCVCLAVP